MVFYGRKMHNVNLTLLSYSELLKTEEEFLPSGHQAPKLRIITSTGLNLINCNHIHYSPLSTLLLCVHPRYNLFAHSPALHTLSHCTSYPLFYFLFVSYFILTIFVYIYILSRVLFHSFYCFYVIMFYLFFALSIERTCPD